MLVCDCRYKHLRITKVEDDDITLEDGAMCSFYMCCDPVPHEWKHPDVQYAGHMVLPAIIERAVSSMVELRTFNP